MQDFRKLEVWQVAHQLTLNVYQVTKNFPSEEKYGLSSQLRRSVASIPTNIAEGRGRATDADFCRFVNIAMGSASEAEYQVLLARDLNYITQEQHTELEATLHSIKRMLTGLMKRLRAAESRQPIADSQ